MDTLFKTMQMYLFYIKTYLFQKPAFYFELTLHQQAMDVLITAPYSWQLHICLISFLLY